MHRLEDEERKGEQPVIIESVEISIVGKHRVSKEKSCQSPLGNEFAGVNSFENRRRHQVLHSSEFQGEHCELSKQKVSHVKISGRPEILGFAMRGLNCEGHAR